MSLPLLCKRRLTVPPGAVLRLVSSEQKRYDYYMKDTSLPSIGSVYLLKVCSWGDFDILHTRTHSAHLFEDNAREYGLKIGLSEVMPEDDRGDWFEIEKVNFHP